MQSKGPDDQLVSVGDSTQLTFHQLQDIYNALTGKTESITKNFTKSYHVNFGDLEQLHERISQACTSYGAQVKNESVTVYHINGQKEQFSSFDRFRIYNASNVSPVENVSIEYHFLILPADSKEPKKYMIRINLPSRVGMWKKTPGMLIGYIDLTSMLTKLPAIVRIDFVDYAAARHFLTQIEEWYEALDFTPSSKFISLLQRVSHWFCQTFAIITMIIVLYSFFSVATNLEPGTFTRPELFRSISLVGIFVSGAWLVGHAFGRLTEWAVDRIQPLSFVHLNRGDEKCIAQWRKRNFKSFMVSAAGVIITIAINIAAVILVEKWF